MNTPTQAVIRVGGGRGFIVEHQDFLGHPERIVITAAHCLPHLPPPHPASYTEERTYGALLGPLKGKRTVWAECLFVDPITDIAVLGSPDNQEMHEEAAAYEKLTDVTPLPVANAPKQKTRSKTLCDGGTVKFPGQGKGSAQVLSLANACCNAPSSAGATDCRSINESWSNPECQARRSCRPPVRRSV